MGFEKPLFNKDLEISDNPHDGDEKTKVVPPKLSTDKPVFELTIVGKLAIQGFSTKDGNLYNPVTGKVYKIEKVSDNNS